MKTTNIVHYVLRISLENLYYETDCFVPFNKLETKQSVS